MISQDPIIVEVRRGSLVESRHRVHAVVADADGAIVHAWGEAERETYPRSAIKPLQTLALIESGAAAHFDLSDEQIALAAASHSAAPAHIMAVEAFLEKLGMSVADLACGPQTPMDAAATAAMIRRGEMPTRLHNNCSGKHAGFLATALHLGEPTAGYLAADHPVQRRLYDILVELGGAGLGATARGVDGCGIPVYGMPLVAMARGMARMADPSGLEEGRAAAARRIVAAMAKHAFMVGGKGRFDTVAMQAGGEVAKRTGAPLFVTKTGAEGVHTAILPGHGDRPALGVGVKAEDGAKRASDTVIAHLLKFLDRLDGPAEMDLAAFLAPVVVNAAGDVVGDVRPEAGWDAA